LTVVETTLILSGSGSGGGFEIKPRYLDSVQGEPGPTSAVSDHGGQALAYISRMGRGDVQRLSCFPKMNARRRESASDAGRSSE
jgi:hypothetical protein